MDRKENSITKTIIGYFLQGLLYLVPFAATIYVIISLFQMIDGLLLEYIPFKIPGSGIVVLFVVITIAGFIGNSFIAQPIQKYFSKLLNKAPLLKTIYKAIEDLMSAFVGNRNKRKFNTPVLVQLSPNSNLKKPGFITEEDLTHLGLTNQVAVYMPHSYAFSGNVYIVDASCITKVEGVNATAYMKFIVSGGVSKID